MFWRFNYSNSQIPNLLEKEDVTLKEILDEEDVLQECKTNNEKLVNFLIRPENLDLLIENSIELPSDEINEKERFKYSTISCELLTSDIPAINDSLIENEAILEKLYSFLANNNQDTVNSLMASYFAKIFGCLISRKAEQFLSFIQKKEKFLQHFLQNINTSAITEILLRFLTNVDTIEIRHKVVQWLKDIGLVNGLVDLFSSEHSDEVHSNASQLFSDLIRISRDQILNQREAANDGFVSVCDISSNAQLKDPNLSSIEYLHKNSLLEQLESEEILDKFLKTILESVDKTNNSLLQGIDVFMTLLEPVTWSNEIEMNQSQEEDKLKRDKERIEIGLYSIDSIRNSCFKHLSQLSDLLQNSKPKLENYKFSNGMKIPVVGQIRLSILKLINRLLNLFDDKINQELIRLGLLNYILSMMFLYKWNNFLHVQIKDILINCFQFDFKRIQSMADQNKPIEQIRVEDLETNEFKSFVHHLFKDCNLFLKLVHFWSEYFDGVEEINEKKIMTSKPKSVGYVGHLALITNFIRKQTTDSIYSAFIKDCFDKFVEKDLVETWDEINENKINKLNTLNSIDLVHNPFLVNLASVSDAGDFIELPSDEKMNRKFSEMHQEMKINCVQDFSLSESQIVNFSTKQSGGFDKTKAISFSIDSSDDSAQMFEQVCQQRDNMNFGTSCPDISNLEDDMWVKKEIRFSENQTESTFDGKDNWAVFSSEKDFKMKIEHKNINDEPTSCIKKYSEKISNFSSSSSSSSSDGSSDSEDDNQKNVNPNKRHHNKSRPIKEMRQKIDDDIFKDSVAFKIEPLKVDEPANENWADFDKVFTKEEKEQTLEINDPWSAPSTNQDNANQQSENWANFDNC
ncbi:serine threonine- phosphatase 6 regulatory subunit 3 isoform X1 [Brachionus plicatilis]|uniref:Serine threonine-phosphatase 6 regulatory subunit 3 isoform X1 n=1 Tax=Brachionus plicatilis TaxID=10195 RepID=A0A3M7SXE0_BRAPC|nr:serine threonine- phosphatase 6 regulatory subunit 3 isoform X1 [Brachionus plicatilis]